jgi:hypothetical protein
MSFYNSTGETGGNLVQFQHVTLRQEDVILRFFRTHPGRLYTPSQINQLLPQAPITSIRRALSNLTRDGWLVKTTSKRQGQVGRPEHCWLYPHQAAPRVANGELFA